MPPSTMPPSNSPFQVTATPSGTLMAPVIASINHLLAQEAWARQELAIHAGKDACIDGGALALRVRVTPDGLLEASAAPEAAGVTIRFKLADLPLIAQNHERAFSYVKIEGDAEFANAISLLSKSLRWEAEHDLEPWIGTIASKRLVAGTKSAFQTLKASHQKLAENVAEFFIEEQPLLVRALAVDDFGSEVFRLRDDVERATKRLAKLEAAIQHKMTRPVAIEPTGAIAKSQQQSLDL